MKPFRASLVVLFVSALFVLNAAPAMAQSSTTGALTGTVTDPSGAVISGATVTITNTGTGQSRTATTDTNGSYKFSLLPPGNYSVTFSASGFKSVEVPSVTVNVTETPVLNHMLEVGQQTQQVTVEATAQAIQTQNATVGTLVGSKTVTTLPLNSRNYTQIIDLSPGVVANVASAAAVGNGTQDINVNGMGSDQNNYMMDGATITNYGSGGGAQSGNFPGIGIPNPDSIQEFKIQTSQYDAEYGRNPGASVNVVTKGGTNSFHGDVWEFFRNSAMDANDFFNKHSEQALRTANKPEILNENLFGGTIGGPIKKDKLFFFGSYQGIRQKNGIGTNGFATGLTTGLTLLPFSEPDGTRNDEAGTINEDFDPAAPLCNYSTYRGYLGCVFANDPAQGHFNSGFGTHVPINPPDQSNPANDAVTNINLIAVNFLREPGPKSGINQGFYFPSVPFRSGAPVSNCFLPASPSNPSCSAFAVSSPIEANEDQYIANLDYVINTKNTLSERFFTSRDPQNQPFVCLGPCQPGAPEDVAYTADSGVLKLTTVATSNLVNEATFSFQRGTTVAHPGNYIPACGPAGPGIIPPLAEGDCANLASVKGVNPIPLQIPTISSAAVGGAGGPWNNGGNFFASATNFFNYFQGNEVLSWNHGRHAIRTGFWVNRIQYNWTLPGRGGMIFWNTNDFLTSSSGLPDTGTAAAPGGILVNFYGLSQPNGNPHYQRTNEFAAFVEDDIKATPKLTLNLGLRWEYDGYPSDVSGLFTDGWPSAAKLVNTGSFFLGGQVTCASFPCANAPNQIGTLVGYVVQSNYNPNVGRCGVPLSGTPCGLTAPAGIFPGYPGGATGVLFNNNKTLVHGAPIADFGPRIGLAWQATNRFVVRAGYGIFYDAVYANLLANNNAGNAPYSAAIFNIGTNSLDLPAPLPGGKPLIFGWRPRTLQVTAGNATDGATHVLDTAGLLGVGTTSDSEFLGVPLVQQYNLDLQYEVARDWIVDIGYVGTHGTHLYDWARPINVAFLAPNAPNEPTDRQNARMIIGSGAPGTPNSLPFNDGCGTAARTPASCVLDNTAATINLPFLADNTMGRVSYLGYGTGGLSTTSTLGDSLYNSLQAQLRHQFSNGLLLQASYTWSKLMTNINSSEAGGGIAAPGNVLSGGASSNDPLDFGQQYGLAAFNRPQRLVVAYSYDFPYKKQQGFTGHVLGGWTISGITTIQDGEPFSVRDSNAGRIYYGAGGVPFGGGGVRAELAAANTGRCSAAGVCQSIGVATGGSTLSRVLSGLSGGNGWINKAAYTAAPCVGGAVAGNCAGSGGATGFGDSGVGAIMGPGQHNWDLSLIKNTKVTEETSLEFRAEFYNIWNHPQFNPPANNFGSFGTLGEITQSSVPPRVVQFALKFYF